MRARLRLLLAPLLAGLFAGCAGDASDADLVIGTTTSLQDAGLLDALLPAFERDTGLRAVAVVGGTGEIIAKGMRGDVDALLTHSPEREQALLDQGWTIERRLVMHNRFVLAGPAADEAGARTAADAVEALRRIHENESLFVSRGDRSGTHDRELALWRAASLEARSFDSSWYKETGSGQGATLLFAHERGAYLLVDEPTLLRFHARGEAQDVVALNERGEGMRNDYAVSLLHPQRVPDAPHEAALAFADWLAGPQGQAVVAAYEVDGRAVFAPVAGGAAP